MRAYIGYDGPGGTGEGAVLIFANTAKEARRLGFGEINGWFDTEWIDMRVNWLKNLPNHLKKLDTGDVRVIDSPPSCPNCMLWGYVLVQDGKYCEYCFKDELWD